MATSARYDSLKKQSRTLEGLIETKLSAYSKLAATVTRSTDLEAGNSERFRDLGNELEDLLEKVGLPLAFLCHSMSLTAELSRSSCATPSKRWLLS